MLKELDVEAWINGRRQGLTGVYGTVSEIIDNVRNNGDSALYEYAKKFDKIELEHLRVTEDEIDEAYNSVEDRLIECLTQAEARIAEFHEFQKHDDLWLREVSPGVTLGVKTTPLSRVGGYIPEGVRPIRRRRS